MKFKYRYVVVGCFIISLLMLSSLLVTNNTSAQVEELFKSGQDLFDKIKAHYKFVQDNYGSVVAEDKLGPALSEINMYVWEQFSHAKVRFDKSTEKEQRIQETLDVLQSGYDKLLAAEATFKKTVDEINMPQATLVQPETPLQADELTKILPFKFEQLSPKVISTIAHNLSKKDLYNLSLVSKPVKRAFQHELTARNVISLIFKGEKGPVSGVLFVSYKKIIKMLPSVINAVQALVLPEGSKIIVVGDLHGGFNELCAQLFLWDQEGYVKDLSSLKLQDNYYLVFCGDLADRGTWGVETWMLAMALMEANPGRIFICRGNHEDQSMARNYGFDGWKKSLEIEKILVELGLNDKPDLERLFLDKNERNEIRAEFNDIFNHLPFAVFLGIRKPDGTVSFGMFNHGGLDPRVRLAIRTALKKAIISNNLVTEKMTVPADEIRNLNWGDYGVSAESITSNARGREYNKIGAFKELSALEQEGYTIDFIARGHKHVAGGVLKLNDPGSATPFTQLPNKIVFKITGKPIFTFMCVNLAYFREPRLVGEQEIHDTGSGVFHMDKNGDWYLMPHILQENQIGDYLK